MEVYGVLAGSIGSFNIAVLSSLSVGVGLPSDSDCLCVGDTLALRS